MSDDTGSLSTPKGERDMSEYNPPRITCLGTVADLTQKTVGAADGATFLGLDIGSI